MELGNIDSGLIIELSILLLITTISATLGTLKHIFINKKQLKPAYVVTFIDAIMYGTIMKQISSGNGVYFILTFAVGKLLGTGLGDLIENKLALGIIEVDLYVNHSENMKLIADNLRELGYSVDTGIRYGYQGKKRYVVNATILRKELDKVKKVAQEHGYNEPTVRIREISKVYGKFNMKPQGRL